jgi:hypothetical protein
MAGILSAIATKSILMLPTTTIGFLMGIVVLLEFETKDPGWFSSHWRLLSSAAPFP